MSGSGGFGGYELPRRAKFDCLSDTITVKLSSIDLNVLTRIAIGDKLEIEISQSGSLAVIDKNGQTLGAVMHANTVDIINCIKNGNDYIAVITNIATPTCTVKIKRA